jgi:hypothetical protein
MHRIAIGDPQGIRHQLFAKFRVWMMENPSGKNFIRGAAAALVWPVAAIGVVLSRSGTVFMSISPRARGWQARAVRQRASDHSLWRAGATSTVGIFGLQSRGEPDGQSHGQF